MQNTQVGWVGEGLGEERGWAAEGGALAVSGLKGWAGPRGEGDPAQPHPDCRAWRGARRA